MTDAVPYVADPSDDDDDALQAEAEDDGVKFWLSRISAQMKIEDRWRKEARKAEETFFGGDTDPYFEKTGGVSAGGAIAHSNLEIMRSAIFSRVPQPIVRRRFNGDGLKSSQLHRHAAEAAQRLAAYLMDETDIEGVGISARDQWLVPGRGAARVVYEAEIEDVEEDIFDPSTGTTNRVAYEKKVSETARLISWPWADIVIGSAGSWDRTPWVAFSSFMTRPEFKKHGFSVDAKDVNFSVPPSAEDSSDRRDRGGLEDSGAENHDPSTSAATQRALVWEVWDRDNNRTIWLSPGYTDGFLDEQEDPLELKHFFPMARPLLSEVIGTAMQPRPDVAYYERNIREIDILSARLTSVRRALRLRGLYAGSSKSEITKLFGDASSGKAIEVTGVVDWMAFMEKGGIDRLIAWVPIDALVAMANVLAIQIEQEKAAMNESSGLSDIVRGQGDPRETAMAQGIKGKFAGMRLGSKQGRFAIWFRDNIRLLVEVAVEHFDTETIAEICQIDELPFEPGVDPETGEPVVSWHDVHEVLRSDFMRSFVVQIETDDTILVDEEQDRDARVEFLTAFAALVEKLLPMVSTGAIPLPVVKSLLLFAMRGFRKARMLEDMIQDLPDEMPAQEPPMTAEESRIQVEQIRTQAMAMMQAEKLGHEATEAEKDREAERKMKGVEMIADAARMQAGGNDHA